MHNILDYMLYNTPIKINFVHKGLKYLPFSSLYVAVDLKNPPGRLYRGEPQGVKAGCTMTIDDDNFVALANGDLNPQQVIGSWRHYIVLPSFSPCLGFLPREDQDYW